MSVCLCVCGGGGVRGNYDATGEGGLGIRGRLGYLSGKIRKLRSLTVSFLVGAEWEVGTLRQTLTTPIELGSWDVGS